MAKLILPKDSQAIANVSKTDSDWKSEVFGWRCSSIKEVVEVLESNIFDNRNLSYSYHCPAKGVHDIAFYLHKKGLPRVNLGNGRLVTTVIKSARGFGKTGVLLLRNKGINAAYPLVEPLRKLLTNLEKPSYKVTPSDKRLVEKCRPFIEALLKNCDYGEIGVSLRSLQSGDYNFKNYELGFGTDCKIVEVIDIDTGEIILVKRDCLDRLPVNKSGYVYSRFYGSRCFPSFNNYISKGAFEDDL